MSGVLKQSVKINYLLTLFSWIEQTKNKGTFVEGQLNIAISKFWNNWDDAILDEDSPLNTAKRWVPNAGNILWAQI